MLRLRFTDPDRQPPHRCAAYADGSCSVSFAVAATNESGAPQCLASPLELVARLVDADGVGPLLQHATLAKCPPATIGIDGSAAVSLSLRLPSPVRALRMRIELSAPAPGLARLVPASTPRADRGGGKWVPTVDVPVASIITPVIELVGDANANATTEDRSSLLLVHLPPPCGLVRIFERHAEVTGGFGTIVWDNALVLTSVLASSSLTRQRQGDRSSRRGAATPLLRGVRAIDLGTGTGFVGIAAALLGASVLLTDLERMLPIARANARANANAIAAAGGALSVAALQWGDALPDEARLPFDLVLASEVAYRAELFGPLVDTLERLVPVGSEAAVLLGARQRACCELDDFIALLRGAAFEVETLVGPGAAPSSGGNARLLCERATAMSKTLFAPQVFRLSRRRVQEYTK